MPEGGDGEIKIYGATWCPDCELVKNFLDERDIPYLSINVEEDPQALAFIEKVGQGKESVPTLQLPDGTVLIEPSIADIATRLGLKREASPELYDTIILGGGPAGLTAAIYAAREGMRTLVIEKAMPGGQAAITEWIENYPGFPEGIGGLELSQRMEEQARRYGVEISMPNEVTEVIPKGHYKVVRAGSESEFRGRTILIATGSSYRRLGAPGEEELIGRGISYCATCDGPFFRDKEVFVVGGGNSAAEEGIFLTKFAAKVTLLVRGSELRASKILRDNVLTHPKMAVQFHTAVTAFHGNQRLQSVSLEDTRTGASRKAETAGVFVFIGLDPNSTFLKDVVPLDEAAFVITGPTLETSVPGIFAAGDVRKGSTKQVASAAGEGVTAALMIRHYLRDVLASPQPYDVPAAKR